MSMDCHGLFALRWQNNFPLSKTFAYTGNRILNKYPKIYKHINKKIQLMEDT